METNIDQERKSLVVDVDKIPADPQLSDFWMYTPEQRDMLLLEGIKRMHFYHFERNASYRRTVLARGVNRSITNADLPRLLRPTAQTFKSYIEILGTPFPYDKPREFLDWLADQLSIPLPKDRYTKFRTRYSSLEAFLKEIEQVFSDLGFEVSTSSGTSGRSTIMVRDQDCINRTVESFYLSFQRYLGMRVEHRAVFIMPRQTRIAMVRMASFSVERVGMKNIHFTIPFPAYPDMVRIRSGRIFRPGLVGSIERKVFTPFANWMNDHYVTSNAIHRTLALVEKSAATQEKLLLFAGWVHLHLLALELRKQGKVVRLAPGSILGTGGGMKEQYPVSPPRIREALAEVFQFLDGRPIPILDTYGMAESNWAAMQCQYGNYHIPPWVYTITLNEDNQPQQSSDATGLLAFYDPFGGGRLFPAFFRTADRMHLINGSGSYDQSLDCSCGEVGAYIKQDSIQRVDLISEAGCAAQI